VHRRAAVLAAAVSIAIAAPVAADPPTEADRVTEAAAAFPVIGNLDDGPTPVVLRATLTGKRAKKMITAARQVYDDVNARFVAERSGETRAVTLVLAATEAEYGEIVAAFDDSPSPLGFYRPDLRVAVINLARGVGNLRHELVHPLLGDDYPNIPSWLNEGLGSLYGTSKPTKTGMEPKVNYRLRDLQRALRDDTLPTVAELVRSRYADVHGNRAMTYYAMGRYVMLYLHRRGRLDATYAALRGAAGDVDAQRDILAAEIDDDAFRDWAGKLRYGR
jgi:hypothetical protein